MIERDWSAIATRLLDEGLIPISAAAKMLPPARRRGGGVRHVSASALVRWILDGKRGVCLEACRGAGKTWWTSRPAVARFLAAQSSRSVAQRAAAAAIVANVLPAADADRQRRAAAAAAELERMHRERKRII